ncbi:MAG: O-antigen ligase family protein [bacterium]
MAKRSVISAEALLLAILLIGGVGFIPFFFSRATIDPALTPRFTAWAGIILLLIVTLIVLNRQRRFIIDFSLPQRALFLAAGSYALISAISLTQAINLAEGIFELLKILLALGFLFLASTVLGAHRHGVALLAKAMILAAIVLTIVGICQYFLLAFNSIPGNYLVYATMANKNLFASALLLMCAFVLYGVLAFEGYWRGVSLAAFALINFCLLVTHSRAVWLALLVATLGVTACLATQRRSLRMAAGQESRWGRRLLQALALAVIITSFAAISHGWQVSAEARVAGAFARPRSSVDERLALWARTRRMIREHPVLGVGLGNWKIVIPSYGTAGLRSEFGIVHFQQPHNDYLWVWSESGPVALLSYLAIFGVAAFYAFKIMKYSNNHGERLTALLMSWGMLGYLVVAGVDFPKERIEHAIFLILILAVILSSYHRLFPLPQRPTRFLKPALAAGAFLVVLAALAIGYQRCLAEMHTHAALLAREAGDWERVVTEIDQAESRFANLDPTAAPLSWYKGMAHFSLNQTDQALQSFRAAYAAHPNHLFVLNNLATCYELTGEHARAIAMYQKALEISPHYEETLLNLSAVYFAMQDYEQAYQTLRRCDPASQNPKVHSYLQIVKTKLAEAGYL